MEIILIAAIGSGNELGKDNEMLWNLPGDMNHFKMKTMNNIVVMGRKTFESIGRPLKGRTNIVMSRSLQLSIDPSFYVINDLTKIIQMAYESDKDIYVIGGAEIYNIWMPLSTKMYITHVHSRFEADTFFPDIDMDIWGITNTIKISDRYKYTITTYRAMM